MSKEAILDWNSPIEKYFEQVARIPRESGHEEAIAAYLLDFAKERGLESYSDDTDNVIIRMPASPGYENARPVMLQAHTDMVCVKTPGSTHDFRKDPIDFYVKDGIMRAVDTSLGADDGWGVAYMLAILDDDSLAHPPLECVFTAVEEDGMIGAKALDASVLTAKRMISLDGDVDVENFVSCFTSDLLRFQCNYAMEAVAAEANWRWVKMGVGDMSTNVYQGLCHSECGNAIKTLVRLLENLMAQGLRIRIADMAGGLGEQYGPETCVATIAYYDEKVGSSFKQKAQQQYDYNNDEYENTDFRGRLHIETTEVRPKALSETDSRRFIDFLYLLPNNLFQANFEQRQLNSVNNIGKIALQEGKAVLLDSSRSRYISAGEEIKTRCGLLAECYGWRLETEKRFEGWPYNSTSEMRRMANEVMQEIYGCRLRDTTCPGGLEIAVMTKKVEGMDAIELGVNHENPHSTDEAMEMASFHKMYTVVLAMLAGMRD